MRTTTPIRLIPAKNDRLRTLLSTAFAFSLLLCLPLKQALAQDVAPERPPAQDAAPERQLAQDSAPEQQLAQISSAIATVEQWLNSAANNRTSQERDLRRITQQIETLRVEIAANKEKIAELSELQDSLALRDDALQTQKLEYEAQLRFALRASYKSGQESYLKLLLNQEDPTLSARMLHYFGIFNRQRSDQIKGFRDTLAQIEIVQRQTEQANQEIVEQLDTLGTQELALRSEQENRESILIELDQDIASRSGELEQLQQDRQRLEELIERINEAIASIPPPDQLTPFAAAKGTMPLPVQGRISNRFGASYSDGNLHRQGLMLAVEQGTPVRSIHPGRVVFSDWLRGSGLLVVVDHGEGYLSLYANNESLVKHKGDWVNRGEPLATAGSNSGSGEPGIYFEIRHSGTAQDPLLWCQN